MSAISISLTAANTNEMTGWNKQTTQAAAHNQFDGLLAGADSQINAKEIAGTFIQQIMSALENSLSRPGASTANAFPFSEAFSATFGDSGPLLDFINVTTSSLHLSAKQNLALQEIAVRHKDITNTPANVAKIADELKQAGIG